MELDYDWSMWYLQQQQDHDAFHGGVYDGKHLTDHHDHRNSSVSLTSFLGFEPIFKPLDQSAPQNYPMIMPMSTLTSMAANDDNPYAELCDLVNVADDQLIDPIISPSHLQLFSHQQNYQILGIQDFNDFETWWNTNLSILLYSDISNAAEATMDTKPVLNTSTTCSTVDVPAPPLSEMLGNFNLIEDRSESLVTNDRGDFTDHQLVVRRTKRQLRRSCCRPKSSNLGYEDIQKYFHVPITKAAQELRVGVTVLKKRCRELAIVRWPHRKIKSLNGLIDNVKEYGGITNEEEIKMLEEYRRALEMVPGLELTSRTKKLRQACFKVNYKRRKLQEMITANSIDHHHHPCIVSRS